jgi:superfamily II DNA or RNA helicase
MAGQDSSGRSLEQAVSRLLLHRGWINVQLIGGSGDKKADILAVRRRKGSKLFDSYLVQVKSVAGDRHISVDAINEGVEAQTHYKTNVIIVATNGDFTPSAVKRKDTLKRVGFNVQLWNGATLKDLLSRKKGSSSAGKRELREYQRTIVADILSRQRDGYTECSAIVATGLGKTVIAATVANTLHRRREGFGKILVVCHSLELVNQLQQAFWAEIDKEVPTHLCRQGVPVVPREGISFVLYQSLFPALGGLDRDAFDLIIVDEAHHALAPQFSACLTHLKPRFLLGMTATPWRGDSQRLTQRFGESVAKLSLLDGVKMGYLAKVDYRLKCDNIRWDEVRKLAKTKVTIKDLNRRLFVPQRDAAVLDALMKVRETVKNPRVIIFSPSKKHAEAFAKKLTGRGVPARNLSVTDTFTRRRRLLAFAAGQLEAVTAVDVLNEGIDVPAVNILVFLRATHSRRIFTQQLGRGLRIIEGKKTKVVVLDFVSDIRRLAIVREFDREARDKPSGAQDEVVHLPDGVVTFDNERVGKFVDAWLEDVTSLDEDDDDSVLTFPDDDFLMESGE